jgi:hypothetical protein
MSKTTNVKRCVKVSHIPKVCRHLDIILNQASARTGPVSKRTILSEHRHPPRPDDDDTIWFVQLEHATKLTTLMYFFHDYQFHGKYLKAELGFLNFSFMEEYTPIVHKCLECNEYNHMLRVRERRLLLRHIYYIYITERINRANIEK